MKKKSKINGITKFTIALGLCIAIILTSIILVNIFTEKNKNAKAEAISNDGYSFAFYDEHNFDAQIGSFPYFTNRPETDSWSACFAYFARDGEPYNFPNSQKTDVRITFQIYNPNNAYIYLLELNDNATNWGSTFQYRVVDSNDTFIEQTLSFDAFSNNFGGICFDTTTRLKFYCTYCHVEFRNNGVYTHITFGSEDFFNIWRNEYERGYNEGYTNGLSSGTTDAKYGIFNGASLTATFVKEDQSTDVITGIEPVLNNSTLSWENVYDYWLENYFEIENIENAIITINFAKSFDFASNPIYVRVDSDVTDFIYNNMYNASWNYLASTITNADTLLTLELNQNAPKTFQVDSLSIYFGRVADTLATGYINATNDSFNQGRQVGFLEGYNEGKSEGNSQRENEMYNLGYNRGYTAGTGNRYSFATLFTAAIEAPINAILNGFNVEILGMNIRNFYLSLFSLALVIVVVKLILFRRN